MADISQRPYSKNYSGLINQTVLGVIIGTICFSSYEYMRRKRRGRVTESGLGRRETWQFGYLFQGRSWAAKPSPPISKWPLGWIFDAWSFPMDKFEELRGIDATMYIKWMEGIIIWIALQTATTFAILLPVHLHFCLDTVPTFSMTRASISSLGEEGQKYLWIHVCLMIWITLSWMGVLVWISDGVFAMRQRQITKGASQTQPSMVDGASAPVPYNHPHPQYSFQDDPPIAPKQSAPGLKLRTVMVSNVPEQLRSESELEEYFKYYLSRPLKKPSIPLTSASVPGPINKAAAFIVNRFNITKSRIFINKQLSLSMEGKSVMDDGVNPDNIPHIERVVVVRKMTYLASLLSRREETLKRLETAHILLARRVLAAVNVEIHKRAKKSSVVQPGQPDQGSSVPLGIHVADSEPRVENIEQGESDSDVEKVHLDLLVKALSPFVKEFEMAPPLSGIPSVLYKISKFFVFNGYKKLSRFTDADVPTIWDVLHTLPREVLDRYQPLVRLSFIFRGRVVGAIDYYDKKLRELSSRIAEERSKPVSQFTAAPTAFVTFTDPADVQRALKFLAVHPDNPLVCIVTRAPQYEDLDWIRLMRSVFKAEFLRDWAVTTGVWAFTLLWIFPVSALVTLFSISAIAVYFPPLRSYLDNHQFVQEVIQSTLPTLIVSLLALLIPLILLLIAKKGQTITTLSAMHDKIMIRYYKFLIINVLVFFCFSGAAVSSVLSVFNGNPNVPIVMIVQNSFPIVGPFYVSWLIFTTAIHGCIEVALFGLPLILYPSTKKQPTPRRRMVGTRPRTFNFYYWLPNHLLIVHILLLFAVLNPLVTPFGLVYFLIDTGVIKNQLLHVYAKIYEGDGRTMLIRMIRYSLDGLMFSQAFFLAYMAILSKTANIVVTAILLAFTFTVKLIMTRMCRAQYEADDIAEANAICRTNDLEGLGNKSEHTEQYHLIPPNRFQFNSRFGTVRMPAWVNFSYRRPLEERFKTRGVNPFGPKRPLLHEPGPVEGLPEPSEDTQPEWKHDGLHDEKLKQDRFLTPSQIPDNNEEQSDKLVTPRPPLQPWNDMPEIDLPYDNPYYTRSIRDVLWLPKDPVGLLNLDETVDLHLPLKSTHIAPVLEDELLDASTTYRFNGDEEIVLPEGIAKRLKNMDEEGELEPSTTLSGTRPSIRQRSSSLTSAGTNLERNRSTASRQRPPSVLSGITGRARASSILSRDGGVESPMSRNFVTAQEAIISEVLEEEKLAEEQWRREEGELIQDAPPHSSWLQNWLRRSKS